MFLYGERARVELEAEDFNIWDESSPSPADGEDQQLSDNLYSCVRYSLSVHKYIEAYTSDGHRGIAEEEELVQALVREMRMSVYTQLQIPDQRTGIMIAQIKPSTQERSVDAGISGSSVLATAERTSGYGESSSELECKPNIDLRKESGNTYLRHLQWRHPCQYWGRRSRAERWLLGRLSNLTLAWDMEVNEDCNLPCSWPCFSASDKLASCLLSCGKDIALRG